MKHSIVPTLSALTLALACSGVVQDDNFPPSNPRTTTSSASGSTTSSGQTGGSATGGSATGGTPTSSSATGQGGASTGPSGTGGTGGAGGEGGGAAGASGSGGASGGSAGTAGRGNGGAGGRDAGGNGGSGGSGGAPPPRDGGPPTGVPARDVQLTLVEANQGSAVALYKMGTVVPVAMRNAELIEGRPTLVRAHVDVATGWMARSILGVLTLAYGDGTRQVVTQSKNVTADSTVDQLNSTINFLLTPAEVKAGTSLSVELQEVGPVGTPAPATPPRFPPDGMPADFGIKAGAMELTVVVIPFETAGGFAQSTEERRQNLYNHLFDIYPVQKVNITWSDPKPLATASTSAGFALLREQCMADGASAKVMYHGMLRGADANVSFAGVASGSPSSATTKCRGVAITIVNGATAYINGNINTTAHEIGHNHSRRHIDCGGAAGPDTSFPYQDGFLGVQGYSISENALKPTSMFKELMGYCRPRWVSDWQWNALAAKIRTMMPWPVTSEAGAGHTLSGYVETNGEAHWAIIPGRLTEPGEKVSANRNAKIWTSRGIETLPVSVIPSSEPSLFEVVTALPEGPLPSRAVVTVDGRRHTVDLGAVKKF